MSKDRFKGVEECMTEKQCYRCYYYNERNERNKRIRCPKTDKKRYINNFCLTCRHRSSRNGGEYFGTETYVLDGEIILLSGYRCTKWEK